jgi:hypothetical protein
MAIANNDANRNIDQLNSFLRGEISAVETYRIALDKLDFNSPARRQLEACRASHQTRVMRLQQRIFTLGGTPATQSGPWGTMAKALEGGAAALGDKVAIKLLEEGEDHGLKDYRTDLEKLGPDARALVTGELLPLQVETHQMMSNLKNQNFNRS